MNSQHDQRAFSWRADLAAARDLTKREISGFEIFLGWFESWRLKASLPPGREAATGFWKSTVLEKAREPWQLQQWAEAVQWYLGWLSIAEKSSTSSVGNEVITLEERVYRAVDQAGARRGLARRTRQTYAGWVRRYATFVGEDRAMLEPKRARDFLTYLVAGSPNANGIPYRSLGFSNPRFSR